MRLILRVLVFAVTLLMIGIPMDRVSAQTPFPIGWPGYSGGHVGHVGEKFTYYCPPFDPSKGYIEGSNLYGTDLYSDDSGICVAALHAGVITQASGGAVTILINNSPGSFKGSTRNGVTSKDATENPSGHIAFAFLTGQATPVPSSAACSQELEKLTVASNSSTPYTSKTVLADGQNYTVVVSGVVGLYPNTNTGYDALYDYRTPNNPALFQNGDSLVYLNDQPLAYWINLAGGSTAYRDDHVYATSIPGSGQPLVYHFHEGGSYDDNAGDLTIQLCAGGTAPSGMLIQAPRRLALPGELLLIPVSLKNAANVANLNFDLEYDPAIIKIEVTPDKGNLLDNALFSSNPATAGLLHAGFAQTSGLTGSGTVLNVLFRITGKPGDKTPLALRVTTINDPGGSVLNIAQLSGEVDVTNPDGTLPGSGSASCQQPLETLTVSSQTRATVVSKTVLTSGQAYSFNVSGVVGLFPNTNTGFDALYDYRKPGQEGRVTVDAPANDSLLLINGHWFSDLVKGSGGSTAYRSDHIYAAGLIGTGQPMTVQFSDWGSYDDNSGSLSIKLCAGGGGNGTGLNAPVGIPHGDCDGDLQLTEVDALCALEMSVQLRPVELIIDMDNSGDVTSRDAVVILQKAVGK